MATTWRARGKLRSEEVTQREYLKAIDLYQSHIKPDEILEAFRHIRFLALSNADMANRELRALSDRLRTELYDLPRISVDAHGPTTAAPRLMEFISARRFTLARDLCLKLLIACISVTAIFDAPDCPDLSVNGLRAFLGMFITICLVTYGNKSLCRHFLHKGRIRQYIAGCVIFVCAMTGVMVAVESISYVHTIHNGGLPLLYSLLATLSSFCTLALYLGGITALVLLHSWLRTERRRTALQTETAKTELRFLQSQINPHFLFNVLNNIGILIYEDPHMASDMFTRLSEMFEYQMKVTHRPVVSLSDEVDFLNNYLMLEQSRKSPFCFSLTVGSDISNVSIPSLLLIPFVENASKHSTGTRNIEVSVAADDHQIRFECSNMADAAPRDNTAASGLGVANTRRRLELLYGSDFSLNMSRSGNVYKVSLKIPRNDEMYHS